MSDRKIKLTPQVLECNTWDEFYNKLDADDPNFSRIDTTQTSYGFSCLWGRLVIDSLLIDTLEKKGVLNEVKD